MKRLPKHLLCHSALILCIAASVNAEALMINFRNSGGPTGANLTNSPLHTAVPTFTDTTWNNTATGDVASSAFDWSDGTTATGIAMNLGTILDSTSGNTIDLTTNPSTSNNLGAQTNTGIYAGDSIGRGGIYEGSSSNPERGLGLQITGLSAGSYDIYISGRNTNVPVGFPLDNTFFAGAGAVGNFDYSGYATSTISYSSQSNAISAWVTADAENDNYSKFSITLTTGQAINIAAIGSNRGFINSLQIIAVPEPSTWALLAGLSSLSFAMIRRRYR